MNSLYIKYGEIVDGKIERGGTFNGFCFKDEEAFLYRPNDICYMPELSNKTYTKNDIIKIANGDMFLANEIFYFLDWQHPETVLDEIMRERKDRE